MDKLKNALDQIASHPDSTAELDWVAVQGAEPAGFLACLVACCDDAVISEDLNGLITSWNPAAKATFGYSAAEVIGKPVTILFPPELIQEELLILEKLRENQAIPHYRTERITKAGRRIHLAVTVSPIRNSKGVLVGASKVAREISPDHNWEETLQRSETRSLLAVEAGEIGIWSYNLSHPGPKWDNRCKAIFSLDPDEDTPGHGDAMNFVHPADRTLVEQTFAKTIAEAMNFDVDFRVLDNQGRVRWVQTKGLPVLDASGKVTEIHGTLIDLTIRKQREEQLRRKNEELQQFAYAAAHDLQEPLRNVALLLELLKTDPNNSLTSDQDELLNSALTNARHMNCMVKDLLAFSSAVDDSAQWPLTVSSTVLAQALEALSSHIQAAQAQITWDPLPAVSVKPFHLQQVFQNLLSNALKYRRSEPPRIHIRASWNAGFQEFSVRDNGIGIDPSFHAKIFGLFTRLHDKSIPGTGIGLALCRRIVQNYGGEIWIESAPGQGAVFHFTVPASIEAHEAAAGK